MVVTLAPDGVSGLAVTQVANGVPVVAIPKPSPVGIPVVVSADGRGLPITVISGSLT